MKYEWMRVNRAVYGYAVAAVVFFVAGPGTANANMLTFCGVTAPAGVFQVVIAACVVPGGGTIAGTATEIDLPTFHEIRLSPLTITCLPADVIPPATTCQGQEVITANYQTFIGPGINGVTIEGTLTTIPPPPPPPFLNGGETIFESGQGTTFNNNPAVVSGTNQLVVPPAPFFFTQTKEGDFNGKGTHIVGFAWTLSPNEQFILPASVDGDLAVVPEPSTLLFVAISCLGLLGYAWRRLRAA
jgi:hypothetical protein